MPRVSQVISVPAPIGGWNVRDPLPSMSPAYAPILDNVFCLPSEIQIRKGYTQFSTFTGTAETVFDYNTQAGGEELYAAVSTGTIYNITAGGAVGAAVVTGLSNARFHFTQFSNSGGTFLYLVNGANTLLYDGTTWRTITTSSTPYAITGISPALFSDVIVHKRRLWFVEKNSTSCWYLPVDAIAGAAVEFDFGPLFKNGGYITKVDTWSLDAGVGLDDYFVVFSSKGEVAVYQGTDPASASTWSLTGVFLIGEPVGNGRTSKMGGDLLILNKDGIAQMSKSLMSSRVNTVLQLTDKIQPQLSSDATAYSGNYGWDILLFSQEDMLIVNVPVSDTVSYQYVMNTISGAWSRWTGINAKSWYFSADNIYFGANGYVGKAWNTQSDNTASITANILPAYQNFGATSQLKRFTLMRALLGYDANAAYGARMEIDFDLSPTAVTMPTQITSTAGVYGTSTYGSSVYVGSLKVAKQWKNTTGMGYWASPHLMVETYSSDVRLYSIDLVMEAGGNL
jgi:hypothetical protein